MNDLQLWTQRALVQLHKEARAGVLLGDWLAQYGTELAWPAYAELPIDTE